MKVWIIESGFTSDPNWHVSAVCASSEAARRKLLELKWNVCLDWDCTMDMTDHFVSFFITEHEVCE